MKNTFFILFAVFITLLSCNNDEETTRDQDADKLAKMHENLINESRINSETCTNIAEWDYVAFTDACGWKQYIIYSKKIDKKSFLKKIQMYQRANKIFLKKWNPSCAFFQPASAENIIAPQVPTGIECSEGKPRFKFTIAN